MADDVPRLDLGLTAEAKPIILLENKDEMARDMATLLRLAPGLASPAHAADLARAANHLAHGGDYRVITDPHAYEVAYRARLAKEDPNAPFREGVVRLRDFGMPDFAKITAPQYEGGKLTFFAADMYLGVPYKVVLDSLTATPQYAPVPLTPFPAATRAVPETPGVARPEQPLEPPEPIKPLTPDEEASRRTHMPSDVPR